MREMSVRSAPAPASAAADAEALPSPSRRAPVTLLVAVVLAFGIHLPASLRTYPRDLVLPFAGWLQAAMMWLTRDTPQIPGLPSIKTATRAVAAVLDRLLDLVKGVLATGFRLSPGDGAPDIQPLPWFVVALILLLLAAHLSGRRLVLATAIAVGFILVTGNWTSAMVTLASVLVGSAISVALGLALGLLAYRLRWFSALLSPVLDLMQTVPVFAYLVPVLMLLGFGPAAALAATMIYATPPMIRNTELGLKQIAPEIAEFGLITGCTQRQLLLKILVPSALPSIMVGVNQVVMMTLNMVIIASMIGAGGLGFDVLTALRRLDIGSGLEAGLAIVALAILLDRFSQAFVERLRAAPQAESAADRRRRAIPVAVMALLMAGGVLALAFPALSAYPADWVFTARQPLNTFARWLTLTLAAPLDAIKTAILIYLMMPLRVFLLGLPWFALPVLAGFAAWRLSGPALAATVALMLALIFMAGLQQPAMMTVYLCGLGTLLSLLIGVPLGILGAFSNRAHQALGYACDTLQTLPSFVYLIPVVMLFKVGDFSALVAIVAFAVVPAIRYTDFGLRQVRGHFVEAGLMSGCTPLQALLRVQIPLAMPHMLLGVSQTVVMALSMLVITALVGTRDLGQETYIALTKADAGRGIVAGLAIAFLAITTERLIAAGRGRLSKTHDL